MAAATFTCPECDAALRGVEKVPAGKKVKCPSCSAIFILPERKNIEAATGIREKPLPSARMPEPDDEQPGEPDTAGLSLKITHRAAQRPVRALPMIVS